MATERHNAIEWRGQFPTDDDRLAEHLGRILDAAIPQSTGAFVRGLVAPYTDRPDPR